MLSEDELFKWINSTLFLYLSLLPGKESKITAAIKFSKNKLKFSFMIKHDIKTKCGFSTMNTD